MMISVKNLAKHFKTDRTVSAVDSVSFELQKGKFLSIVGRSGSGKSTLLGMTGGILHPSAGSVVIDGTDIWRLRPDKLADFRNAKIGFVFQFASLLPTLRVIDNVALPQLARKGDGDKQAYARARALIERVGLADRLDFYPAQLSGGEQRRVAIARALINAPAVVLADEPTADLDEQTEAEILSLLVDIQKTLDLTMVIVTHNPDIAAMADRTIVMRAGRAELREGCATRNRVKSLDLARERNIVEARELAEARQLVGAGELAEARQLVGAGELAEARQLLGAEELVKARQLLGAEELAEARQLLGAGELVEARELAQMPALVQAGRVTDRGATSYKLRSEKAAGTAGFDERDTANGGGARSGTTVSFSDLPLIRDAMHSEGTVRDIYDIAPQVVARESIRLGEGIDRFVGRFVLWAVPVFGLMWIMNLVVADYEHKAIQAQTQKRLALEELAMKGLRADIKDVTFGPGKSYIVSLYLRNTEADRPLYVMNPSVRGFIQVGSSWQEVPIKQIDKGQAVQKIEGEKIYRYSLEPSAESDFAQLIPYYMHIRLSNEMLVSPSNAPKDDLIDRSDNYYVYLKPHGADDRAILKRLRFPDAPPVWIPMPPH